MSLLRFLPQRGHFKYPTAMAFRQASLYVTLCVGSSHSKATAKTSAEASLSVFPLIPKSRVPAVGSFYSPSFRAETPVSNQEQAPMPLGGGI